LLVVPGFMPGIHGFFRGQDVDGWVIQRQGALGAFARP
jgi:hypothetical protein